MHWAWMEWAMGVKRRNSRGKEKRSVTFMSLLKVKLALRKGTALRKDLGPRLRAGSRASGKNLCPKN